MTDTPATPVAGPQTGTPLLEADAIVMVAMAEEAQPFLERLPVVDGPVPQVPGGAQAWRLRHGVREIVLVRSGIGLVAAASALATVLTQVSCAVVISAGTTGGLARNVEVGDVCVSTDLAYTDVDATAFGYAHGQTPGQPATFPGDAGVVSAAHGSLILAALRNSTPSAGSARVHAGQMLAGGSFVTARNVKDTRELFPRAVSTDMESTALAQVCHAAGMPFAAVRGISDLCGPEAGQDFHIGADEAATRSAAVVLAVLGSAGQD